MAASSQNSVATWILSLPQRITGWPTPLQMIFRWRPDGACFDDSRWTVGGRATIGRGWDSLPLGRVFAMRIHPQGLITHCQPPFAEGGQHIAGPKLLDEKSAGLFR